MGKFHDMTSRVLFWCAGGALALAVSLYVFEIIARYFFNAPTSWSGELVQYCLCVLIFFALPEVTRKKAHVAIDMIPEMLSPKMQQILRRINALLAGCTCFVAGAIVTTAVFKQFDTGLLTNAVHPIPRWWITSVIMIGLISSGIHFIRKAYNSKEVV